MPETPLPQIALPEIARSELDRRRAKARAAVAARQRTTAQVEPQIRAWTAIALWFHADLSEDLRQQLAYAEPTAPAPVWIDLYPGERADRALLRLAHEARRAAQVALTAHEQAHRDLLATAEIRTALQTRASNLLRLDHHLSLAAHLTPLTLSLSKGTASKATDKAA